MTGSSCIVSVCKVQRALSKIKIINARVAQGWSTTLPRFGVDGFESRLALYWKPECVSIPVLRCGKIDEKEILVFKT